MYGAGISTHTITHSLEKADLIISINTSYGNGYVTIDGETVKNKILMDGLTIQSESISATFSAEKGEEGEKYINLLYSYWFHLYTECLQVMDETYIIQYNL